MAALVAPMALYAVLYAQAPTRVMGEVTAKNESGVILRTDSGDIFAVVPTPGARIQRVAPGETDLTKARPIQLEDIAVGDRVLAVGVVSTESKAVTARLLVAISNAEIEQKRERERTEWQTRGVAGLVRSVDPSKREIAIRIPGLADERIVTIALKDGARLRRYAPDSVRFADAQTSTLAEIREGDQLRALGDQGEGGASFAAEEIVTGSFRTVAGKVASIDPAAGVLTIEPLEGGGVLTVKITANATVRRMPQMGMFGGGPGPGSGPGGGFRPDAGPSQGPPGGFAGRGRPDFQQMLERMPQIESNEIQAGETVIVSSTNGKDSNVLIAITMLAGAEGLIRMRQMMAERAAMQQGGRGAAPASVNWNLSDMSMIPMP